MSGALTESMKSSERLERCRRYGFDCADFLEWKGWDVGGEYKLTISLKNVGKKMTMLPSSETGVWPFWKLTQSPLLQSRTPALCNPRPLAQTSTTNHLYGSPPNPSLRFSYAYRRFGWLLLGINLRAGPSLDSPP